MKILQNKLFQKIVIFSCILFFELLSSYYLFKIYSYNRGSRTLFFLFAVFFIVAFFYIVVKSAQRIFRENVLSGQKYLFISALFFILAILLKFLHLNQILGIDFNFSVNYSIFLTIAALLFTSIAFVFFATQKITDSNFNEKKLLIIIIASATLFYFFLTTVLYLKFSTSAFDLGIFDQVVWKYSQFKIPFDTIGGINDLADHFEPILFFVGLLYKIWSSIYVLLLTEAFIVAAGFYPIFKLAKKYLGNQKSAIYIGLGYLFSLGIVQAIHYPVHPGTWLPTFYAFAIYFIDRKKYFFYALFLLLAALSKESSFIHILFIGIFVAIYFKERIAGLATAIFSICYYIFVFKFAMPHFNHGLPYTHGVLAISNDPKIFIKFVICHPIETLRIAFDNSVKAQTLYLTLGTVGFLAIFSVGLILLIVPFLVERLLTTQPFMMTMSFHYSAPITAIVFIVAIFALKKFKDHKFKHALSIFIFLCSFTFMFSNYFYESPINNYLSFSTYKIGDREKLANEIIKKVPAGVSVTSQDAFVTHLDHRGVIKLFDGNTFGSDYILLAKTSDYSFWPTSFQAVQNTIESLRNGNQYTVFDEDSETILFKKIKQ